MDIILILFIVIGTFIFLLILGVIVTTWERSNKVRKLKENLSFFPPDKLKSRLEMYKNEVKLNEEISELETRMDGLEKREYLKITKLLKEMQLLATPIKFFSFIAYRQAYIQIFELISRYEKEYLEVRFILFDLTADIEIEKAILKKLKDQTAQLAETIDYSPIERISSSRKLEGKMTRLRQSLKKLEDMIEEQAKHLSNEFIESEEKISKAIVSIANDVDFMNQHIKHLTQDLKVPFTNIVDTYQKHKAVLTELNPQVTSFTASINQVKKAINEDIDNLKIKDATKNMEILDDLVNKLYLLINSNVDYAKFNFTNDKIPLELLKFVKDNHGLFTSEIRRHRLQNEQTRLLYVEDAYKEFEEAINKYELEKLNQFNKHAPDGIHQLFMNTIRAYDAYIIVVLDNVRDISEVNASTNEVNMIIAKMNTSLLQVEHNIKSIDGLYREQFEKEKEELQNKVKILRDNFKENTRLVDNKSYEIINKITKQVDDLVEKSKGAAFKLFFLKESIMYLNRFKGTNKNLDLMIESVSESFNEEKHTESLRKVKEIIEIYGIK